MSDYSELKRLAEAATPGPWGYDGSYVCPSRVEGGTIYVEAWRTVADCHQPENTKFIAAANPAAVLALIADNERLHYVIQHNEACFRLELGESERLRKENEELRSALENAAKGILWLQSSVPMSIRISKRASKDYNAAKRAAMNHGEKTGG